MPDQNTDDAPVSNPFTAAVEGGGGAKESEKTKKEEEKKETKPKEETSQSTDQEKPKEEKPVEKAPETPVEAAEEEEGDHEHFFWVFQRIAWGVLKSLIILAILGLVIWFIWGAGGSDSGSSSSESTETDQTVPAPKDDRWFWEKWFEGDDEATPSNPSSDQRQVGSEGSSSSRDLENTHGRDIWRTGKTKDGFGIDLRDHFTEIKSAKSSRTTSLQGATSNTSQAISQIVRKSESLVQVLYDTPRKGLISQTISWLERARVFAEIETRDVVQASSPPLRAQKIEDRIKTAQNLFREAAILRARISEQVQFWEQNLSQLQASRTASEQELSQSVTLLHGVKAEGLLQKTITLHQAEVQAGQTLALYQRLLSNLDNFERLLRQRVIPVYRGE